MSFRPIPTYASLWYSRAFTMLSNSRTGGYNGPNPIQLSEILSYYNYLGAIDDLELFIRIIQSMDEIFLKYIHDQQEKESKQIESKQTSRKRHGR